MDITNKTATPITIPLPGGKKLFLGPGKSGQVSPKALEHPPLAKLLEAGSVVTVDGDPKRQGATTGGGTTSTGARRAGTGARRQSGDR